MAGPQHSSLQGTHQARRRWWRTCPLADDAWSHELGHWLSGMLLRLSLVQIDATGKELSKQAAASSPVCSSAVPHGKRHACGSSCVAGYAQSCGPQIGRLRAYRADKVEERPELAQAVLDGGAADDETPARGQAVQALAQLRLGVLDGMALCRQPLSVSVPQCACVPCMAGPPWSSPVLAAALGFGLAHACRLGMGMTALAFKRYSYTSKMHASSSTQHKLSNHMICCQDDIKYGR